MKNNPHTREQFANDRVNYYKKQYPKANAEEIAHAFSLDEEVVVKILNKRENE